MRVQATDLPGVLLIEPRVIGDCRGFFMEVFHARRFSEARLPTEFVQDNCSQSRQGTLRGLHYQEPNAQGKLVQVLEGAIWDVVVDIRRDSPAFGKWCAVELSATNRRQVWVPPGFAHGFCVTSASALCLYKCTALYAPESEQGILWSDPDLAIAWPVEKPILSDKDSRFPRLREATVLPAYGGV